MPYPVSASRGRTSQPHPPPVEGDGDFNPSLFILNNAVAYWKMADASSPATDTTGNGNDLTATGCTFAQAGKVGNAIAFNGTSDFLSRASTSDLQIGANDFIVATWVKMASLPGVAYVFNKLSDSSLLYTGDRFTFTAGDGAGSIAAETFGAPSTDTWYLIVCRLDAVNQLLSIRVNNGAVDSQGLGDIATPSSNDFFVGAFSDAGSFFDGLIDDTLMLKTSEPMSSEDFDALCTYLWASGNGLDLSFIF